MDKFGKSGINWPIVIGAVIAAYLLVPGFKGTVDGLIGGIGTTTPSTPSGPAQPQIECIHDGATMTLGPAEVKYTPTTSLSAVGIRDRVLVNGKDRGMLKDGATVDVNYKDNIVIYYNFNDTNAMNPYYATKQELTVPCTSSFSSADEAADGDAYQLTAAALPTFTAFNDDDSLQNTPVRPENLSANDATTYRLKMTQAAQTGYSPYGKIYLCLKYNSTVKDKITLSVENGGAMPEIATPDVVTAADYGSVEQDFGVTTGTQIQCWEEAGIQTDATINKWYLLYIKTGATTLQKHTKNFTLSAWDESYFRNTISGKVEVGPANDQDAVRGKHSAGNLSISYSG